jgi:hypothetical protein
MSLYDDAVALTANSSQTGGAPPGPLFWYRLDDSAGSATYADSGEGNLPLTTFGSVTEGNTTIMPGDDDGASMAQAKDSQMASRADNVLLDRPAASPVTVLAWFRPDTLRPAQTIVAKPSMYGFSVINRGQIRCFVEGQADLLGPTDLIVAGGLYCVCMVWNPTAQNGGPFFRLFVNGVQVAGRAVAAGQSIAGVTSSFFVGGQNALGSDGLWGRLQQVSVWYDDLVLSSVQGLYQYGARSQAEVAGLSKSVFPFPVKVSDANPSGAPRRVVNDSDHTIYVAEDPSSTPTAIVGGGWRIPPHGGVQVIASTRQLSAVHRGTGVK